VLSFTLAEEVVEVLIFFGLFEREDSLDDDEQDDSCGENIDFSAIILLAFCNASRAARGTVSRPAAQLAPLGEGQACLAQFHALALGTFASLVAPFGGFLASAIKRAYGIKDFDTFLPGHGGLMDRFDCQFIMATFSYVYHQTFCRSRLPMTVDSILTAAALLSEEERRVLLQRLQAIVSTVS